MKALDSEQIKIEGKGKALMIMEDKKDRKAMLQKMIEEQMSGRVGEDLTVEALNALVEQEGISLEELKEEQNKEVEASNKKKSKSQPESSRSLELSFHWKDKKTVGDIRLMIEEEIVANEALRVAEIEKEKERQARLDQEEKDAMAARELERIDRVKNSLSTKFRPNRRYAPITGISVGYENEEIVLRLALKNNTTVISPVHKLHLLGFLEWKDIALYSYLIEDKEIKKATRQELTMMVTHLSERGMLEAEEVAQFIDWKKSSRILF